LDAFPAFFPLTGRRVVIAGAGEAAEAKARLFDGSPAELVRAEGEEAFAPETYAGAVLAFVASDDAQFRQAAAAAARSVHVPVNVVDHPADCDFYTPAVIDRGQVVAAVGTDGASPMLASMLRGDIEARIPEGAGRVAALLRRYQGDIREALPDASHRRAFLRDALSGPAAVAALTGDMEKAGALLLEALAKGHEGQGAVRFVAGRGPPDLLTLRALRVLAAADLIAADEGADPQVVALARRDAERLSPADATPEQLIALAQAGRRVVRLLAGPVDPAAVRAILAAGVQVDVILAAPPS
jgi:precorrin-2 dehydrogenase/sirohydrochlorin ferrochelatase